MGVTDDAKLMFKSYIDNIVSKAALRVKLILKCFHSRECLLTRAFCTFVRPILEHCCIIWNHVLKHDINSNLRLKRKRDLMTILFQTV